MVDEDNILEACKDEGYEGKIAAYDFSEFTL